MSAEELNSPGGQVEVVVETVLSIDAAGRRLTTSAGRELAFDALCICVGSAPKVIPILIRNPPQDTSLTLPPEAVSGGVAGEGAV